MIDINKVRRFETALAKHTNSQVVAQIWNELEPQIITATQRCEQAEMDLMQITYHNARMLAFILKGNKLIAMADRTLKQARALNKSKGAQHGN